MFIQQGAPHATYDKLTFTELLDVRSTNISPQWKDGFKVCWCYYNIITPQSLGIRSVVTIKVLSMLLHD